MPNPAFLEELMSLTDFPAEAQSFFLDLSLRVKKSPFAGRYDNACLALAPRRPWPQYKDKLDFALAELAALAAELQESPYSLYLLAIMDRFLPLREEYRARGLSDELFLAIAQDLHWKLNECRDVYGVWGTFVPVWFTCHLSLELFALGRFQYQTERLKKDLLFPGGRLVPAGTFCLRIHIPSGGGPLNDDVRLDSYRRAARFFSEQIGDGPALFTCESWLLYPPHREMLPGSMNILRFMDDFTLLEGFDEDEFHDAWRVFGSASLLPLNDWPADNSLRRAYVKRLSAGGKSGRGEGYFILDQ